LDIGLFLILLTITSVSGGGREDVRLHECFISAVLSIVSFESMYFAYFRCVMKWRIFVVVDIFNVKKTFPKNGEI
jgi:hypothetical protein